MPFCLLLYKYLHSVLYIIGVRPINLLNVFFLLTELLTKIKSILQITGHRPQSARNGKSSSNQVIKEHGSGQANSRQQKDNIPTTSSNTNSKTNVKLNETIKAKEQQTASAGSQIPINLKGKLGNDGGSDTIKQPPNQPKSIQINSISNTNHGQTVSEFKEDDNSFNPYDISFSDDSSSEIKIKAPVVTIPKPSLVVQTPQPQKQNIIKTVQPQKLQKRANSYGFEDISEDESHDEEEQTIQTASKKQPLQQKTEEYEEEDFENYEDDFEQSQLDNKHKIDYHKTDLNKLNKEELDKHKAKMEINFKKNQTKPGDNTFVYDKRETFNQNESNDWDEDLQ